MDSASNASSTSPEAEPESCACPDDPGESRWRRVVESVEGALDLLFPPTCVSCHGLVEADESGCGFRHLCASCRRRVVLVRGPHCTTCGYPFFGVKLENSGCPHCELLRPVYNEGRTATLL
ncbi:MAG TPA: double zinc ribbon domain-containing protein [Opitutaceae bacterium]